MKLSRLKAGGFLLATLMAAPAFGANTALPGTLNYVEGQVQAGSQDLSAQSVGSVDLEAGQTISTEKGRAEVLLTPGVFLRLDDNSVAKMISPSLTNTEVELDKGRATLEVAEIHKQNDLKIDENGATTQLLKKGLYEFDANNGTIQVFDGKAQVEDDGKSVEVKGGRELSLNADPPLKPQRFDKKKSEDDFYSWNALRSQYEAEANVQVAQYVPAGFAGPGWFWDPWFSAYTFVPGNGIFYSPFGWGFYSPAWISYAPVWYGVPYRYYGGHWHGVHPHGIASRPVISRPVGGMRTASPVHSFRGAGRIHGVSRR